MTIDLAWKSLSPLDRARIINFVDDELLVRHTSQCSVCTAEYYCGAIQHIVDLLNAMEAYRAR